MIGELKEIIADIENRDFSELTVVNIIGNLARVCSSLFNTEEIKKALFSMAQTVSLALKSLQVSIPKPDISVTSALYDSVNSIQKATERLYEGMGGVAKELEDMSVRYAQGYSDMQMAMKDIVDSLNTTGLVLKEDIIKTDSEEKDD